MRQITVVEDPGAAVAERLTAAAEQGAHIVLTGGSTPRGAYAIAAEQDADWSDATVWFSDERCVPPDHPDSNFGMAHRALLSRLEQAAARHAHRGRARAPRRPPAPMRRCVREHLGNDPRFDLLLLGMGPDAHVASLFPGKPELEETRRLVVGVPLAGMEPQVPRVTLTLPAINRARVVDFLVSGEGKAEAVARAFGDPPDPEAPAARVRPRGRLDLRLRRRGRGGAALRWTASSSASTSGAPRSRRRRSRTASSTTRELIKTNVSDSDALVAQLVELIGHLRSDHTVRPGSGVPSIIEFETGRIAHSVNIPLQDLPLRQLLTEKAGIPVYIENDASCAALAEAFDEDGNLVCPNLVMITVGTGIGGGMVFNGRLYRGATAPPRWATR